MSASLFHKEGALEKANRLFDSGHVLQAIQLLTEQNRQTASAEVEQRLVEMRHQGFFHLAHGAGLGCWPPERVQSPYPAGTIPAVSRSEFSAQTLKDGIIGHGSLIVRQLLTPVQVKRMVETIDNAILAYDAGPDETEQDDRQVWYSPLQPCTENGPQKIARKWVRDGGGVLAADSPRAVFNLTEILGQVGVLSVLGEYLGERPALSVKKTTLRRVPVTSSSGWHQDGAFLGPDIRTVNLWIALSDCGVDAPSMDMVPKRLDSIVPTGTGQASFSWSLDDPAVMAAAGDTPPVRLEFKAGDAILFDERNLHRTAIDSQMSRDRYAIEAWFFAPSHYPLNQLPILC
jgi:hypothetical protein